MPRWSPEKLVRFIHHSASDVDVFWFTDLPEAYRSSVIATGLPVTVGQRELYSSCFRTESVHQILITRLRAIDWYSKIFGLREGTNTSYLKNGGLRRPPLRLSMGWQRFVTSASCGSSIVVEVFVPGFSDILSDVFSL